LTAANLIPKLAVRRHTLERGADVWAEEQLCLLWIDLLMRVHFTVFVRSRVLISATPSE
jgi:hypothetical protein